MPKLLIAIMVAVLVACFGNIEPGEAAITDTQNVDITQTTAEAAVANPIPETLTIEPAQSLLESTANYATTDEEELRLYNYESIPQLNSKTDFEIIDDFLAHDDLIVNNQHVYVGFK